MLSTIVTSTKIKAVVVTVGACLNYFRCVYCHCHHLCLPFLLLLLPAFLWFLCLLRWLAKLKRRSATLFIVNCVGLYAVTNSC